MTNFAIITDDAAQFLPDTIPPNVRLIVIHHPLINPGSKSRKEGEPGRDFPDALPIRTHSLIGQPVKTILIDRLIEIIRDFDEIFCITVTMGINPLFSTLEQISVQHKGRANFHLIDSQTIAAGQGYLVHRTIQLIQQKLSASRIDEILREEIPNIYTLFCTPNLSYMYTSGFIDAGQAISGEQHSMYPIFGLEDGKFSALEKQKSIHGVVEYFIEFVGEYEQLKEITFLHPSHQSVGESVNLSQFIHDNLPGVKYSEISCNEFMTHLIGPRGFGLVVVE